MSLDFYTKYEDIVQHPFNIAILGFFYYFNAFKFSDDLLMACSALRKM